MKRFYRGIDRVHVWGTSLPLNRVEGSPYKFTALPGVHKAFHPNHNGFAAWAAEFFVRETISGVFIWAVRK